MLNHGAPKLELDVCKFRPNIILVLPIIFYVGYVVNYSANVPKKDDYETILGFLISYQESGSIEELLAILFGYWNEHMIFFNRMVTIFLWSLIGEIDFYYLCVIGNIAIIILAIWYIRVSNIKSNRVYLIILLIVLQPQAWGSMTWAMAALSNYYVLLFSFASIYFLCNDTRLGLLLSLCFAALAVFTQANGVITFIIIGIWLFVERRQRGIVLIFLLALIFAIVIFYLLNLYQYHDHRSHPYFNLDPVLLVSHFFALLGGALSWGNFYAAVVCGMLCVIWFFVLIKSNIRAENKVFFYYLMFLFFSVAIVSLFRSGLGIDQALASRYRVLSSHILVLMIVSVPYSGLFRNNTVLNISLSIALLFNVFSYYSSYDSSRHQKLIAIEGIEQWMSEKDYSGLVHPSKEYASSVLQRSIEVGLYNPGFKVLKNIE